MIKRELGGTGLLVGEVGLGCEHLQGRSEEEVAAVAHAALEKGMNLWDVFMSEPQVRSHIGRALRGKRDEIILQGHIGAAWQDGQYCRTRELDACRFFFEDFMERVGTDYVDIGMIHYVDSDADWERVVNGGMLDYALDLKKKGVIRAVGMSSHNPAVAEKAVKTGNIEVLLFSVNPAYDLLPEDVTCEELFDPDTFRRGGLAGVNPARASLYGTCAAMGVGMTVMKSLGAGTLLHEQASPFGRALSVAQCIHYALTRPAAASVLVGCRTPQEVAAAAAYETADDEERDYSVILSSTPKYALRGKCMYCNHCLPCPSRIDIAQVQRFLDLAQNGQIPETVRAHYALLERHAGDCIECASCEENCPFGVRVIERMRRAKEVFGL